MVLRNSLAADLMYFGKTINPSLICWLYRALNVVDQSSRSFSSCEFLLVCFSMAVFFSVVLSFPLCGRCRSVLFCILTALLILLGFRFESFFGLWCRVPPSTIIGVVMACCVDILPHSSSLATGCLTETAKYRSVPLMPVKPTCYCVEENVK